MTLPAKKAYWRHLQGMAGIYAVAEQLCLLGHTPYFPAVDCGVDVMLDSGIKIQVKCGRLRKHPDYPAGSYVLDVRKGWAVVNGQICTHLKDRTYEGVCDFVVFYGIDEHRFFVIPPRILTGAVWIPPKGAVFQRMGTGRVASKTGTMGAAAMIVNKYENAWDQLDVNATVEAVEQTETVIG